MFLALKVNDVCCGRWWFLQLIIFALCRLSILLQDFIKPHAHSNCHPFFWLWDDCYVMMFVMEYCTTEFFFLIFKTEEKNTVFHILLQMWKIGTRQKCSAECEPWHLFMLLIVKPRAQNFQACVSVHYMRHHLKCEGPLHILIFSLTSLSNNINDCASWSATISEVI